MNNEVSALDGERTREKGELENIRKILAERNNWTKVLTELQRITPDGMWYVVIEGLADKNAAPVETNSDAGGGDGVAIGGDDNANADAPVTRDAKDRKFDVGSFPIVGKAGARRARESAGEIKFIRLVGYTVRLRGDGGKRAENDGSILNAMSKQLEKSKLFKSSLSYVVNDKTKNFQRFEIFLELNEPINK